MKKLLIAFIPLLVSKILEAQICVGQQIMLTENGACDSNPFILEFADEFNGNALDSSRWEIQPWGQGAIQGNPTQEYNSLDNITVANGICKITAKHETVIRRAINWQPDNAILSDGLPNLRTYYYTSSNIWTRHKFEYGKYEIRCKLPAGNCFWPAFWMFGNNDVTPSINDEIDVFEFWDGSTREHNMTVHYNGQMCGTSYNGPDYSEDFHIFTVVWDNYKIEWYVDGTLKRRSTKFYSMLGQQLDCNSLQGFQQYIMDKVFPRDPVKIIVNLAIQNGAYAPDDNTVFPNSLEIDYIRYYKKIPCNGDLTVVDIDDLNLSNQLYNFVIGTTITVGGNSIINMGQQLELVARDEIALLPDFSAFPGCDFIARINPEICEGVRRIGNQNEDNLFDDGKTTVLACLDDKDTVMSHSSFIVRTYPNPANEILSIEFVENSLEDYELYLFDEQGKVVYASKSILTNKLELDVREWRPGVYILRVLNIKSKEAYINTVILN